MLQKITVNVTFTLSTNCFVSIHFLHFYIFVTTQNDYVKNVKKCFFNSKLKFYSPLLHPQSFNRESIRDLKCNLEQ